MSVSQLGRLEASIGTFYLRFAHATMSTKEAKDPLFEYFLDKIFFSAETLTTASWFFGVNAKSPSLTFREQRKRGSANTR